MCPGTAEPAARSRQRTQQRKTDTGVNAWRDHRRLPPTTSRHASGVGHSRRELDCAVRSQCDQDPRGHQSSCRGLSQKSRRRNRWNRTQGPSQSAGCPTPVRQTKRSTDRTAGQRNPNDRRFACPHARRHRMVSRVDGATIGWIARSPAAVVTRRKHARSCTQVGARIRRHGLSTYAKVQKVGRRNARRRSVKNRRLVLLASGDRRIHAFLGGLDAGVWSATTLLGNGRRSADRARPLRAGLYGPTVPIKKDDSAVVSASRTHSRSSRRSSRNRPKHCQADCQRTFQRTDRSS